MMEAHLDLVIAEQNLLADQREGAERFTKYRILWFPKEQYPRINSFDNPSGSTGMCSDRGRAFGVMYQLMDIFPEFIFMVEPCYV